MNRTRFIQGLNSNIELSDKERRRAKGKDSESNNKN